MCQDAADHPAVRDCCEHVAARTAARAFRSPCTRINPLVRFGEQGRIARTPPLASSIGAQSVLADGQIDLGANAIVSTHSTVSPGPEVSQQPGRLLDGDPLKHPPLYQGASGKHRPSSWDTFRSSEERARIRPAHLDSFVRSALTAFASAKAGRFPMDRDTYANIVLRLVWDDIGPRFRLSQEEFQFLATELDAEARECLSRSQNPNG